MKKTNILICGIGAIGGYYAHKFEDCENTDLKVLIDEERLSRYKRNPRIINGVKYDFDYILPEAKDFIADIIIIATKSSGLNDAIRNIKNFVGENTVILSFLNGITSEKMLIEIYGDKVLYSYLLGHTFYRKGAEITHDGHANIIFGSTKEQDPRINIIKDLFDNTEVMYKISDNIITAQWQKFCFNCCANQISAITRMTFGEIQSSEKCMELIKHICDEITQVAEKEGIKNADFYNTTINSLKLMIPEGKTSMLQDIESGTIPETDLFSRAVEELGRKHNIPTPYNKFISEVIDCIADKLKK